MFDSKFINKKSSFERSERVASEIKNILSEIFIRSEIKDKNLFDIIIIITEINLSKDLSSAKVFIAPCRDKDDNIIIQALNDNSYFFKKYIGKRLKIRTVPNFKFFLDKQFDNFDSINKIFEDINQ